MPLETLSLPRKRIYFTLTKNYCLIIMTKNLTGGTLPCIVTRKRSRYIINFLLTEALLVLIVLRLLLWPVRMLNKGIGMSAKWLMSQYRLEPP